MPERKIGPASLTKHLGSWRDGGTGPGYRHLAERLRLLILDGRLPLGARLPGERGLAAGLGVSRTTTAAALSLLREEGFIETRRGSGAITRLPTGRSAASRSDEGARGGIIDLATAALPAGPDVHGAYADALESLPAYLAMTGYDVLGIGSLRKEIAERYARRGLPTDPGQVMVTSGALHGLALLLRALTGPGDRVVIDHPTFPSAIDAIQRASCIPLPVALPGEGWDVEGIAAACRQGSAKLAYVIPDFHNPTGRCMTSGARARLAEAAAAARTTLVFDETLTDLGMDGEVPRADAAAEASVVRLGSTGKRFWGGLRIGWIRAAPELVAILARARVSIDLGTPVLEQLAAATLIRSDAGLHERRDILRSRRAILIEQLAARLPGWRVEAPVGGQSVWAELPQALSTTLAATAELHGLKLTAGPRFGCGGAFDRFMRLPFTQAEDVLEKGVKLLANAYEAATPRVGSVRHPDVPLV